MRYNSRLDSSNWKEGFYAFLMKPFTYMQWHGRTKGGSETPGNNKNIYKNIKISIKVREKYCIKKEMVQQKDIVIREEKEKMFKIQK